MILLLNQNPDKTVFKYTDYPKSENVNALTPHELTSGANNARSDRYGKGFNIRGMTNMLTDMTDPVFAASTILGNFMTEKDEDGNTIITDTYDYSDVKGGDESAYSIVRRLINPDQGAIPVRINLGRLEDT